MPTLTLKTRLVAAIPGFLKPHWKRLEASPLGYRLAKGAFWSLAGAILARSLSVVSSIFVARMLGRVGLGELGIIQSTVGIFSAFAGLGMGLTATKFVAEYRLTDPTRAGAMLGLSTWATSLAGMAMMVPMLILAPWFAEHTLAAPHLAPLIQIGSVLLLLGSVNGAQTGALAGFEAFKTIASVNLLSGVLNFPLMVGGAWFLGLRGAVWGLVAAQAGGCLLSHLALRREAAAAGVPLWARLQPGQLRVLWSFSLPSVLCNLIFGPVDWACNALLVNRHHGYAEMGIYTAALRWFAVVSFLPSALAQVVLPLLSAQTGERSGNPRRVVLLATKANAAAVLPATLVITLASPLIMGLYGHEFRNGWLTLAISVTTAAVLAAQTPTLQAIIAAGRMWAVFLTYLSYGVSTFILTILMVRWGASGLASARLCAYLLNAALVIWLAQRYIWAKREGIAAPAAASSPETSPATDRPA